MLDKNSVKRGLKDLNIQFLRTHDPRNNDFPWTWGFPYKCIPRIQGFPVLVCYPHITGDRVCKHTELTVYCLNFPSFPCILYAEWAKIKTVFDFRMMLFISRNRCYATPTCGQGVGGHGRTTYVPGTGEVCGKVFGKIGLTGTNFLTATDRHHSCLRMRHNKGTHRNKGQTSVWCGGPRGGAKIVRGVGSALGIRRYKIAGDAVLQTDKPP